MLTSKANVRFQPASTGQGPGPRGPNDEPEGESNILYGPAAQSAGG